MLIIFHVSLRIISHLCNYALIFMCYVVKVLEVMVTLLQAIFNKNNKINCMTVLLGFVFKLHL